MEKRELDPWRVVRSFLSRLRSNDVPDVLDRTGLAVDWSLTARQDYSHSTRWAAYRPRIDAAYEALESEEERLRLAFGVARELVQRGLGDEMQAALEAIGWGIQGNALAPASANVRELFFPPQTQHDAYVAIRRILKRATTSLAVVDPYVDDSLLTLLGACLSGGIALRILTAKAPADFLLELAKFRQQHGNLAVRTTRAFHDRFVVIDDRECWHVGCSIKDAGSRAFMISQVEDEENLKVLLNVHQDTWSKAQVVQ